jgi:hypothetical protein
MDMEEKKGLRNIFRGKTAAKDDAPREDSGEVAAAIAMALYLHFGEMHDVESGVVTIKRISKLYSPWSSKLYHMRNM